MKKLSAVTWQKVTISAICVIAIAVRLIWPDLKIDAITLGLLVVAILPWLSSVLKTAKFPTVGKVQFKT